MRSIETTRTSALARRLESSSFRSGRIAGTARRVGVIVVAGAFVSALALPAAAFQDPSANDPMADPAIVALMQQQTQSVQVLDSSAALVASDGLSSTTPEQLEQLRAAAAEAEQQRQQELENARNEAAATSQTTTSGTQTSSSQAAAVSSNVVSTAGGAVGLAQSQLGVPYVFGGASPSTGFDCSGLTQWVYGQLGIYLPHSATAQGGYGTAVDPSNPQPGDLIVWPGLGHSAIYVGGDQIIHAATAGKPVKYSSYSAMVAAFGTPQVRRF